jgi:predicted phage terminase large subunit-like protein
VLILSPTQRQSGELFKKITEFYRELGIRERSDAISATTLQLTNRSRIVSLPGSEPTVRGYSAPSLVLIDEAAQVSDELYYAVRPMFATSHGQLILLSTPRGKQGIFWHAWDQQPDWNKVKVTADQCPRITQEYLDQERRALPAAWFAQEYCCEFVQDDASIFKEGWIQYFDPEYVPYMNTVVQAWDTAQTKSSTSDFVVGQVWGKIGGDLYLLDQVRDRWDFDETVAAIEDLSKDWPQCSAKLIEAQTLGAALSSHLKHKIPGIIPINVKGSKELRALNCVPVWQSKNVYIPKPDDGEYAWVHDYVQELLSFPNAAHDDQVDATTLALNQLRGSLFPEVKAATYTATDIPPVHGHNYTIGWVPARLDDEFTVVVLDNNTNDVVKFERMTAEPVDGQVSQIYVMSRTYNGAAVRVIDASDEALVSAVEYKGTYVLRIEFNKQQLAAAYENLSQLVRKREVTLPDNPELMAELEAFHSEPTFDESADYTAQIARQSGANALCLVTHDLSFTHPEFRPTIYWSFDRDQIESWRWGYSPENPLPRSISKSFRRPLR